MVVKQKVKNVTLNKILSLLYGMNNDLETFMHDLGPGADVTNEMCDYQFNNLHELIDYFEKQLPYKQDSAGDLNPKRDMTLLFQETLPRGIGQ